jgi:hypothetical protein
MIVLRLRTMCYIEPVLVFGTEQDIIFNSHCLSPKRFQRSSQAEFDELHKECHLESGIVLVSLRTSFADRSNQVLATEYSGCLLVYILKDMSQSRDESYL